jgi:hypothetical protein
MTLTAGLALAALLTITARPAHADPRDFTLVNDTGVIILNVYVSLSTVADWQEDLLGDNVLNPGDSMDIAFSGEVEGCTYDIKVVTQDGREGYLYKVDLCSTTIVTFQ